MYKFIWIEVAIMKYIPQTCVWEVTMGCNMRCGHCGSSCKTALPGELNTYEALDLADMIADLGLSWVTLSGGEPLTRKDIPQIVKRLNDNGVKANIITNGWELTEDMANSLKNAGVSTVAISLDGTKEIHDKIRRQGAFDRAKKAFKILNKLGVYTASITTITKTNIGILEDLKQDLVKMGVKLWQVQLGLPMGNFVSHPDWMLEPCQIKDIIDFCYDAALGGEIEIQPADCIGYYDKKAEYVNSLRGISAWNGCNAGIRSFGILHNGDILGCTSIRNRSFIEGNIREKSLREIWEDPNSFSWRRGFSKCDLSGDCALCRYGNKCLGGCPNTRLTTQNSIYSENLFCSFNYKVKQFKTQLLKFKEPEYLKSKACKCLKNGSYQEAMLLLTRSLELKDEDESLILKNISEFLCENLNYLELLSYGTENIQKILEKYDLKDISDVLFQKNEKIKLKVAKKNF